MFGQQATPSDMSPAAYSQRPGDEQTLLELLLENFQQKYGDSGSLTDFLQASCQYLQENRPVQTYAVDANVGVVLSNYVKVILSPPIGDVLGSGQMTGELSPAQESHIPPHLRGMAGPGATPILGTPVTLPRGGVDRRANTPAVRKDR